MSRYYKANEEITLRFYQMPKGLFNNPRYKGLSLGAKAMYSILRDRQELSISNNSKDEDAWVDKDGNIFLLFSIEPKKGDNRSVDEKPARELSLTEILEIDRKTVMKYKKELVDYELIIDKRMGQGKTSRTYVLKPEIIQITEEIPRNVEIHEKSKKRTSKGTKNVPQEVQKFPCNDTDYSDTDFIDTIFLSPEKNEELNLSVDNFKDEKEKEDIKKPNEFNKILENSNYKDFEDKYINSIQQAIRLLYYSDKSLRIGNMLVPPSQVREDLKMLKWDHIDFALRDFKIQSRNQEIEYPVGYLSRCIYNAIFQGDLRMESELLYHDLL